MKYFLTILLLITSLILTLVSGNYYYEDSGLLAQDNAFHPETRTRRQDLEEISGIVTNLPDGTKTGGLQLITSTFVEAPCFHPGITCSHFKKPTLHEKREGQLALKHWLDIGSTEDNLGPKHKLIQMNKQGFIATTNYGSLEHWKMLVNDPMNYSKPVPIANLNIQPFEKFLEFKRSDWNRLFVYGFNESLSREAPVWIVQTIADRKGNIPKPKLG